MNKKSEDGQLYRHFSLSHIKEVLKHFFFLIIYE